MTSLRAFSSTPFFLALALTGLVLQAPGCATAEGTDDDDVNLGGSGGSGTTGSGGGSLIGGGSGGAGTGSGGSTTASGGAGNGSGGSTTGSGGSAPIEFDGECKDQVFHSEWAGTEDNLFALYKCTKSQASCAGQTIGETLLFKCTASHLNNCKTQKPEDSNNWVYVVDCAEASGGEGGAGPQ